MRELWRTCWPICPVTLLLWVALSLWLCKCCWLFPLMINTPTPRERKAAARRPLLLMAIMAGNEWYNWWSLRPFQTTEMWRVCVCVCSVKKKGEKRKAINRLVLLTIARPEKKKKKKSFSYALNDDDMTTFFGGGYYYCMYIYRVDTRVAGQRDIIWIRWCVSRQCTSVRNKNVLTCVRIVLSIAPLLVG